MKNWTDYFKELCLLVASKSEDTSTKCGAIIVGSGNSILSTGYNGLARGVDNTPERNERPMKYQFFEHAERNAIYNAARIGVSTLNSSIYVTNFPCADCARAIIQAGINKIYVLNPTDVHIEFSQRWEESIKCSNEMFWEAEIELKMI